MSSEVMETPLRVFPVIKSYFPTLSSDDLSSPLRKLGAQRLVRSGAQRGNVFGVSL